MPTCMRRAHLAWRLSRPKENSKQKERRAHTQLHMLRGPGLLRSVLVTALDLAHVHAAPANSALFLPEVSLFAFVFLGAELRRRACCVCASLKAPSQVRAPHARGQDQVPWSTPSGGPGQHVRPRRWRGAHDQHAVTQCARAHIKYTVAYSAFMFCFLLTLRPLP